MSMETLLGLSANVNWGYNTRNTSLLLDSSAKLFNYVLPQNRGGQILLQLEGQGDTQVVGAALVMGLLCLIMEILLLILLWQRMHFIV